MIGAAVTPAHHHCPQVGIIPIGVEVQHGPKLPPL
jgi:hypothetical protein